MVNIGIFAWKLSIKYCPFIPVQMVCFYPSVGADSHTEDHVHKREGLCEYQKRCPPMQREYEK